LFDGLTDEQLTQLCTNARIEVYEAGPVVEEGQDARLFLVLMDGEIVVSKLSGDRDIETGRTSHRGTFCGAVALFLENPPPTYPFSVRATMRSRFAVLDAHAFADFMREHFPWPFTCCKGCGAITKASTAPWITKTVSGPRAPSLQDLLMV
jgi:CRP-like cAMP-binding protein